MAGIIKNQVVGGTKEEHYKNNIELYGVVKPEVKNETKKEEKKK